MSQETNPTPRIFKIGATRIVEDAAMAGLSNEQVRDILKRTYPEVAHATIREYEENGLSSPIFRLREEGLNAVSGLTHDDLRVCLAAVAPVELLGISLLKQASPQLVPVDIPRDALREAVTEIIAYSGRCAAAAQRLRDLAPIPLVNIILVGYGI